MLLACSVRLSLLAEGRLTEMGGYFRQGSGFSNFHVALFVGCLIALAIGAWFVSRWYNRGEEGGYRNPRALFSELCRAHELDYSSRRLLSTLARAHKLDQKSQLFLEPERFDADGLPAKLANHRERLETLRDHIFGRSLAEPTPSKA